MMAHEARRIVMAPLRQCRRACDGHEALFSSTRGRALIRRDDGLIIDFRRLSPGQLADIRHASSTKAKLSSASRCHFHGHFEEPGRRRLRATCRARSCRARSPKRFTAEITRHIILTSARRRALLAGLLAPAARWRALRLATRSSD